MSVPPAADRPVPIALTSGPFHITARVPVVVIGPPVMPAPVVATEATPPPGAPAGPAGPTLPAGPLGPTPPSLPAGPGAPVEAAAMAALSAAADSVSPCSK